MNNSEFEACLTSVESVFEQEAEHIVRGEILELGEISQRKAEQLSALTNAIEAGGLRSQPESVVERVKKLQSTAVEHDRHLQAMRHGLSRILGRIDRLQSDAQVGSYNQYGARVQFSGAKGRFERKA